jgi:hypothetical protein
MPAQSVTASAQKLQEATADTGDIAEPSSNTAAVVTYAAAPGKLHSLLQIFASLDGDPSAGVNLKVEDGSGNKIFSQDIIAKGVYSFTAAKPWLAKLPNVAMIITLAAAGSGITGKLTCRHEALQQ